MATTTTIATTATITLKAPSTVKTVIYDLPTKTLNLHPTHPIATADPTKSDHLIHVQAIALCARELEWPFLFPDAMFSDNPAKEIVPGYDIAGTVITSPPDSPFPPGSEVYARTRPDRPGNYREYSIMRTSEMALKPAALGWVDAATVPLSAITAWQALFDHAGVQGLNDNKSNGKRVLVTAAAGGVGVWLVQLARIAGLNVIAQVGSEKNADFVRQLGATAIVNYKQESLKAWTEREGQVDIVVDLLGNKTLEDAWFAVKEGGSLVSIFEPPEVRRPEECKGKEVRNEFFIMAPDGKQLAEITKLLDQGECRPVVDSVWEFGEYEKAFERLNSGRASGKVVVKVV